MPTSFAAVSDPSPAGVFGKAPTVTVPTGAAPTVMELSNLITGKGAGRPTERHRRVAVRPRDVLHAQGRPVVVDLVAVHHAADRLVGHPGFFDGVVGMRVGGRRELVIPPSLGYGDTSPGTGIAKNDTLVFVIDLLKVTK